MYVIDEMVCCKICCENVCEIVATSRVRFDVEKRVFAFLVFVEDFVCFVCCCVVCWFVFVFLFLLFGLLISILCLCIIIIDLVAFTFSRAF